MLIGYSRSRKRLNTRPIGASAAGRFTKSADVRGRLVFHSAPGKLALAARRRGLEVTQVAATT
ncbi:hypothetical protein, partial [Massilia sp. WF1]|uniref:hypothetical protein n=1 Tax=Massilia sp. WF1 TaxID=1406431 RepID=UPI001E619087